MFELGFTKQPTELRPENLKAWNLTYTLLCFIRAHSYSARHQVTLGECLSAIESGDRQAARKIALEIPIGGNSCFNDVFIEPSGSHEDEITAQTCFEALLACWRLELVGKPDRPIWKRFFR